MCDCLEKVSAETLVKVKEQRQDKAKVYHGGFATAGLTRQGKSLVQVGFHEFLYFENPLKKDGSEGKQRPKKISIVHTYCPFCGVKIEA